MALYRVSFRVNGKTYYMGGESSYPSDEAIEKKDIDMELAMENAAVFASAYKRSLNIDGKIEPGSICFEIFN